MQTPPRERKKSAQHEQIPVALDPLEEETDIILLNEDGEEDLKDFLNDSDIFEVYRAMENRVIKLIEEEETVQD